MLPDFTLGTIVGCYYSQVLLGAIVAAIAGCYCWMLGTNFGGVQIGYHCWVLLLDSMLGVPLLGAITGIPLR